MLKNLGVRLRLAGKKKKRKVMWKIRALEAEEKLQNIREIVSTENKNDVGEVTSTNKWGQRANTHDESKPAANYGSNNVDEKKFYCEISAMAGQSVQSRFMPASEQTIRFDIDKENALCGCHRYKNRERKHWNMTEKRQLSTLYSLEECFTNVIDKHLSSEHSNEKSTSNVHLSKVSS